jgi:hypothetical protein
MGVARIDGGCRDVLRNRHSSRVATTAALSELIALCVPTASTALTRTSLCERSAVVWSNLQSSTRGFDGGSTDLCRRSGSVLFNRAVRCLSAARRARPDRLPRQRKHSARLGSPLKATRPNPRLRSSRRRGRFPVNLHCPRFVATCMFRVAARRRSRRFPSSCGRAFRVGTGMLGICTLKFAE